MTILLRLLWLNILAMAVLQSTVRAAMRKLDVNKPRSTTISWAPRPANGDLVAHEAYINLPQEYGKESNTKTLEIYVQRHVKGSPKVHIYFLAGGPGQSSKVVEAIIKNQADMFGSNFALYAYEHRGVGESSRPWESSPESWADLTPSSLAALMDKFSSRGYPPQAISVQNAAWDVVEIAKMIKEQDDNPTSKHILYGISYGSMLGSRVLELAPDFFFSALFIGFYVPEDLDVSKNPEKFLVENCLANEFCRSRIKDEAYMKESLKMVIKNPKLNPCVIAFHKAVILKNCDLADTLHWTLSGILLNGANIDQTQSFHPAMLAIPFIHSMARCPDPEAFQRTLPVLQEIVDNRSTAVVLHDGSPEPKLEHTFAHNFIKANEAFNYQAGPKPSLCENNGAQDFTGACLLYSYYSSNRNNFRNYLYNNDGRNGIRSFKTSTRLYFVHGHIDFQTPLTRAQIGIKAITSPVKKLYEYRNGGHALSYDECMADVFHEVLTGTGGVKTVNCLNRINKTTLAWDLSSVSDLSFKDWWGIKEGETVLSGKANQNITPIPNPNPAYSIFTTETDTYPEANSGAANFSITDFFKRPLVIAAMVGGILLIVFVMTGVIWCRRCRQFGREKRKRGDNNAEPNDTSLFDGSSISKENDSVDNSNGEMQQCFAKLDSIVVKAESP